MKIANYYNLAKPGIVFGNIISILAGYFLASVHYYFDVVSFLSVLIGASLVIAGGCVFNNLVDRDIDALMERTKNRALPRGIISLKNAFIYASLLSLLGFVTMYYFVNTISLLVALGGWIIYIFVYTIALKRNTVFSVEIGAISGSVPAMIGYTALSNNIIDAGAWLIFILLLLWQLPHFYAISIYRYDDFKSANIPVPSRIFGIWVTKILIGFYIICYTVVSVLPYYYGYLSKTYFYIALILGLSWFVVAMYKIYSKNTRVWAIQVFAFSIVNLFLLTLSIILLS